MNYKDSLIVRNQFLTQINASLSKSMNERLLGSMHHLTFHYRDCLCKSRETLCSKENESRHNLQSPQQEMLHFVFNFKEINTQRERKRENWKN